MMASSTSTAPVILSRICGGVQPYPYTTGSVVVSTDPYSNPTLFYHRISGNKTGDVFGESGFLKILNVKKKRNR
ncbi:hypothetical protein HanIR_Chr06g0282471 [Helianthus annuus]|nr:hypothetical protein HanIR_Chr06g0282471 [Helianthus annuus]